MKVYKTQSEKAKRFGVTQQRVSELQREGRIPSGPITEAKAGEVEQQLAEARSVNNATAATVEESADDPELREMEKKYPERAVRIKLIIERTAKIRLERQMLAGGYRKREDVEKEDVAKVYSVRAKLQEIPLRSSLIAHK